MSGRKKVGFSEWLRSAMQANHLTQVEVAKAVGCTQASVSRWLIGPVHKVDLEYLIGLERLFGVPVGELRAMLADGAPPRANAHDGLAERVARLEKEVAALRRQR